MSIVRRRSEWAAFLARYHADNPGITEDLFGQATNAMRLSPYEWLAEVVPAAGTVIDLACGSAPLLRHLPGRRVVGVDRSQAELDRARPALEATGRAQHSSRQHRRPPALVVRGDVSAVPVADAVADAVTVSMALMVLSPVEPVLAEAARLLRPGGVLVATLPARSSTDDRATAAPVFSQILILLGETGQDYPSPLEPASVAVRFAAAGFRLVEDTQSLFVRSISSRHDAEVVARSFYAPSATEEMIASVVDLLVGQARGGTAEVGYPIRRLVAVRRFLPSG